MKILTIVGARPQFIKAATVSRAMKDHSSLHETILHTGQHYDANMSEVFFREMEIAEPKYNLGIKSQLQGEMTGMMLKGIEEILFSEKPDAVLVYGDTNSTLAGALAASKLHLKLIHVEAGLRSHNKMMPEEINRVLTDRVSDLLFCPTKTAVENLNQEGFGNLECRIVESGDVMFDAVLYYSQQASQNKAIDKIASLENFVLCTIHRAENTNDPARLLSIIHSLNAIHKMMNVVLPIHPRTKKVIDALSIKTDFMIIDPVSYREMLTLLKGCTLVMTDSGGLQKEAFFFKKPCICLRDETEWVELIHANHLVLAGANEKKILQAFNDRNKLSTVYPENLFGNGHAAEIIVREILDL